MYSPLSLAIAVSLFPCSGHWPVQAQLGPILSATAPLYITSIKSQSPLTETRRTVCVCLYAAVCTTQTHAASQSIVPLTAYGDGINTVYKKRKGKTNRIIKLCVTNLQPTRTRTHAQTYTQIFWMMTQFFLPFVFFFLRSSRDDTDTED